MRSTPPISFAELDAGRDRGLRIDDGRIGLHAAVVDPKAHVAPTEGSDVRVCRCRHELEEPLAALTNRRRAGEAGRRETPAPGARCPTKDGKEDQ